LAKALESVHKTIKNTQAQLKDVERLLKLDPTNTELLSQKQVKLKESIAVAKEKLDALKTAQQQAKQQMENGDLGKDKYDALQREIIATEEELKRLAKEAAEVNTALNKIGSAGKTLENVGNTMSSVGSSLTRNVTAPILAIGTAAVKTIMDFDARWRLFPEQPEKNLTRFVRRHGNGFNSNRFSASKLVTFGKNDTDQEIEKI
jgi:phage-related minor tail protein